MTTVVEGTPAAGSLRACIVTLAAEPFAVDVRYAREVVGFASYTPVPRAPAHVLGVANLRGVVVPLVDVRPFLGLPPWTPPGTVRALLVEDAPLQAAIGIDDVLGLESFEAITPLAELSRKEFGEFALGILARGDGFVTLLDSPGILRSPRMRPWAHKDG
ncbi:MAG: chemotaxis protein CheW [Candidatus Rokuibacteriota bacterium]